MLRSLIIEGRPIIRTHKPNGPSMLRPIIEERTFSEPHVPYHHRSRWFKVKLKHMTSAFVSRAFRFRTPSCTRDYTSAFT